MLTNGVQGRGRTGPAPVAHGFDTGLKSLLGIVMCDNRLYYPSVHGYSQ